MSKRHNCQPVTQIQIGRWLIIEEARHHLIRVEIPGELTIHVSLGDDHLPDGVDVIPWTSLEIG